MQRVFIPENVLWASYTIMLRYWRLDALAATAVVSVLWLVVTVPGYLLLAPHDRLLALPPRDIALQLAIQGAVSGALTMVAYSRAVVLLGAGRAVLFPAMVPGLAITFGIPLLGELPTLVQLLGLASASAGLLVAFGIVRLPSVRR